MRILSKLALAGVILGAYTTAASAAVVLSTTSFGTDAVPYSGQTVVCNFDTACLSGFAVTGGTLAIGNVTDQYVQPYNDTSHYMAAEPSSSTGSVTFTSTNPLRSLSLYIGSLDTYNTITFFSNTTQKAQFSGVNIGLLGAVASGSHTASAANFSDLFTFGSADNINKVVFSSTSPAFEFDNLAVTVGAAVPEPATWAMMILGFGFVGFMLRSNRRKGAVALA